MHIPTSHSIPNNSKRIFYTTDNENHGKNAIERIIINEIITTYEGQTLIE